MGLEVCESDFSKALADLRSTEEAAAVAYVHESKDNQVLKATKVADVKYKEKESVSLAKSSAEATNDRTGLQAELDAVLEYLSKLDKRCTAKAESYADRASARAAEVTGL